MQNGVSIALVVFNEEKNLQRALASLGNYDGPWEVLVIDNASTDHTKLVFEEFHAANPSISLRWIQRHSNNLGAGRALAAVEARYPTLGFLDADCLAPSQWINRATANLSALSSDPAILALGGGNYPPSSGGLLNAALAIQLSTRLGHLNTAQARPEGARHAVDHLPTCNIFFVRERLLSIGNFSAAFPYVCEDLELSLRARETGYKLIYQPGMDVLHFQKNSWRAWGAKMFRYGRGQIEIARLHPRHLIGLKGLPLLAIALSIAWAASYPISFLAFVLSYLGFTWLYSAYHCFRAGKPYLTAHVFCLFLLTHASYSAGELWGLFRKIQHWEVQ